MMEVLILLDKHCMRPRVRTVYLSQGLGVCNCKARGGIIENVLHPLATAIKICWHFCRRWRES